MNYKLALALLLPVFAARAAGEVAQSGLSAAQSEVAAAQAEVNRLEAECKKLLSEVQSSHESAKAASGKGERYREHVTGHNESTNGNIGRYHGACKRLRVAERKLHALVKRHGSRYMVSETGGQWNVSEAPKSQEAAPEPIRMARPTGRYAGTGGFTSRSTRSVNFPSGRSFRTVRTVTAE